MRILYSSFVGGFIIDSTTQVWLKLIVARQTRTKWDVNPDGIGCYKLISIFASHWFITQSRFMILHYYCPLHPSLTYWSTGMLLEAHVARAREGKQTPCLMFLCDALEAFLLWSFVKTHRSTVLFVLPNCAPYWSLKCSISSEINSNRSMSYYCSMTSWAHLVQSREWRMALPPLIPMLNFPMTFSNQFLSSLSV